MSRDYAQIRHVGKAGENRVGATHREMSPMLERLALVLAVKADEAPRAWPRSALETKQCEEEARMGRH